MNDSSAEERAAAIRREEIEIVERQQQVTVDLQQQRLARAVAQQEQANLIAFTQAEQGRIAALKISLKNELALLKNELALLREQEARRTELLNDDFVIAVHALCLACAERDIDPAGLIKDLTEVLVRDTPLKGKE